MADVRGYRGVRSDGITAVVLVATALAAAVLAAVRFDGSALAVPIWVGLMTWAFALAVRPWHDKAAPDALTAEVRAVLRRSKVAQLQFSVAALAIAVLTLTQPAWMSLAIALFGFFAAWAIQAIGQLSFPGYDDRRLAVWTLGAQGSAFFAAAPGYDSWLAMFGALSFAQAARRSGLLGGVPGDWPAATRLEA